MELERGNVVQDEVALRCLVILEFNDLGPVLAGPVRGDFGDGFSGYAAGSEFPHEVSIGCDADHKFDFGVDLGLIGWV